MSSIVSRGKKKRTERRLEQFIRTFKNMDATQAMGLVRLLGVRFYEEQLTMTPTEYADLMKEEAKRFKEADKQEEFDPVLTPRPTADIVNEMIDKFVELDSNKQKLVLELAKLAKK